MRRLLPFAFLFLPLLAAAAPLPVSLQVDGLAGPVVYTDDPAPRLSWAPTAPLAGLRAWRLSITRTDFPGGTFTREISAEQGPWHIVDHLPLPSRARYTWQVEALFDSASAPAPAYEAAVGHFEVGLKNPADWRARWIALDPKLRARSAPLFRKTFQLTKPIASARLYATGLGWHEAYVNGRQLATGALAPAQTDYEHRVFYLAHDVAPLLQTGANTLALWVGDGWFNQDRVWGPEGLSYGQPRMLAQLEVTHPDGTITRIVSDDTWSAAPSAITSSNVYQGEAFDARLYDPRWSTPAFDASAWPRAQIIASPGGLLLHENLQPCRAVRTLSVRAWSQPEPGVHVADFGQNLTGVARLKIRATPGAKITLRFAESIFPNGKIDPASTGVLHTKQVQTASYVARGDGEETWEPRFSYHVFQYAELTVADGQLLAPVDAPETLVAHALSSATPVRAEFACSDPLIQRMYEMADWTLVGNMQGLPSDCPGRERCGWTGDAHLLAPLALRLYDSAAFWNKYQADVITSAATETVTLAFGRNFGERITALKKAGLPTMIAPGKRTSGAASPDWGSAIVFIPWDIYQFTGDIRALQRNYPAFIQWVEHLRSIADHHIVARGLGDWCTPWRANSPRPSEPRDYYGRIVPELSTACYWRSVDILARSAQILGRTEDATRYRQLADEISAAWVKKFLDPVRGGFADQTINAIAVHWGILPPAQRAPVAAYLARQIQTDGDHFYTGVFGLTSLFSALGDHGQDETIARIFANPASPGFRYLAAQGATTFWEVHPAPSDEGQSYTRSKSHPFQGAWAQWCFDGIAGIKPTASGYRQITLAPQMTAQLEWARAREHTPMGWVESAWKRNPKNIAWTVEIPPGTTATIVPPGPVTSIRNLTTAAPVSTASTTLAPGRYEITCELPATKFSSPTP